MHLFYHELPKYKWPRYKHTHLVEISARLSSPHSMASLEFPFETIRHRYVMPGPSVSMLDSVILLDGHGCTTHLRICGYHTENLLSATNEML